MNILEISVIEHLYVLLNISLFLFHYNSHLHLLLHSTTATLDIPFIYNIVQITPVQHPLHIPCTVSIIFYLLIFSIT